MLNAFGPAVAHKTKHPSTGDVTLSCEGFNDKNSYDRQTPCDQDYLRKLARNTESARLQRWYNQDVMRMLKQHRAFDPEGFSLGDASYLFVPDNPKYERSVRMLFDEHNHPVDSKTVSAEQKARCKQQYGIDVLIPLKKNMDVYEDVLGLVRRGRMPFTPYTPPPPKPPVDAKPAQVPHAIRRREEKRRKTLAAKKAAMPAPPPDKVLVESEVGCLGDFRTWSSCTVPLTVVVNREKYADNHQEIWMLADTTHRAERADGFSFHVRTF